MRNTIVLIALVCFIQNLTAQVSFGVRANIATSTNPTAEVELSSIAPLELLNLKYLNTKNSLSYGVMVHDENDKVFVTGELLYKSSEHEFEVENKIENFKRDASVKQFNYTHRDLSLPIAAGLKLNNFKLGLGPVLNYRLSSTSSLENLESIKSQEDKLNMGFQFQLGYVINDMIHIDLKREMSFGRVGNNYSYNDMPIKMKTSPHALSLSIGIVL